MGDYSKYGKITQFKKKKKKRIITVYKKGSLISVLGYLIQLSWLFTGCIYLFWNNETRQGTSSSCLYNIPREHQVLLRCQANAHV